MNRIRMPHDVARRVRERRQQLSYVRELQSQAMLQRNTYRAANLSAQARVLQAEIDALVDSEIEYQLVG